MPPKNKKKTKKTPESDDNNNDPIEVAKTKGRKKQAPKAKGKSLTKGGASPKGATRTPESSDADTNVDPCTARWSLTRSIFGILGIFRVFSLLERDVYPTESSN